MAVYFNPNLQPVQFNRVQQWHVDRTLEIFAEYVRLHWSPSCTPTLYLTVGQMQLLCRDLDHYEDLFDHLKALEVIESYQLTVSRSAWQVRLTIPSPSWKPLKT